MLVVDLLERFDAVGALLAAVVARGMWPIGAPDQAVVGGFQEGFG